MKACPRRLACTQLSTELLSQKIGCSSVLRPVALIKIMLFGIITDNFHPLDERETTDTSATGTQKQRR